jgi:hypothetical protein
MARQPAAQQAGGTDEALTKNAVEKIVTGNAEALAESGNASRAAIQELTKAYQELAAKNAKNLAAAMQSLAAATTAVFTAAFEPVKRQIEAAQKTTQT